MELLEEVRRKAGVEYISDIPLLISEKNRFMLLKGIPLENYTVREWNDAFCYCFDHAQKMNNYEEIERYFADGVIRYP